MITTGVTSRFGHLCTLGGLGVRDFAGLAGSRNEASRATTLKRNCLILRQDNPASVRGGRGIL